MTVVGTPSRGDILPPTLSVQCVAPSAERQESLRLRPTALALNLRILLLIVTFGLVFEIACRVEDWVRFRTPLLSPFTSQTDLIALGPDGAHGRPNARYQKWVMNELGMRGPGADLRKALGTVRIVTAGASETFGLYESVSHEYPRQLEDSLTVAARALCADNAPRVEVLNAALPGMSLPTVEQDIRLRISKLQPDIISLYPTPVQYVDDRAPVAMTPKTARVPSLSLVRGLYPRAADRLWEQAKLLLPNFISGRLRAYDIAKQEHRHPAGWKFESIPQYRLAQYESDLRRTVGSIRQVGALPVLMTHANRFMAAAPRDPDLLTTWERIYPRATAATLVAFDSAAREVTLHVARDSGVTVVDLAAVVERKGARAFQDYAHFSDLGAAWVAGELRDAIGPWLYQTCPSTVRGRESPNLSRQRRAIAVAR
jgi:hypothetical protein